MGDRRWEMGDGRSEIGDGRWEIGDGRWEIGDVGGLKLKLFSQGFSLTVYLNLKLFALSGAKL
jgi:hypothetical protein